MKLTDKLKRDVMRAMGKSGGKARARKYSKKQLAEWGAKGGRPKGR
jgi:hypothetical protein